MENYTVIQHIEPKYYEVKPSMFYVYIHRRISDNKIFYVGKGHKRRGWSKYRSDHWKRVALKHGVKIEIAQDGLTSDMADMLEEWLIAKFRHHGERLVNKSDGGKTNYGWKHDDAAKAIMSAKKIGSNHPNYGKKREESTILAMSLKARGDGNPFYGKTHSDSTKAKISSAVGGKNNANHNPHLYEFTHKEYGTIICTQYDLRKMFGLNHSNVSSMCSGKLKSAYGWSLKV